LVNLLALPPAIFWTLNEANSVLSSDNWVKRSCLLLRTSPLALHTFGSDDCTHFDWSSKARILLDEEDIVLLDREEDANDAKGGWWLTRIVLMNEEKL
jgi:hypothetical protein